MNPDTFPHVSEQLVEALKESFPITLSIIQRPHELILVERGRQELIEWLVQMNKNQSNPEQTE